MWCLKGREGICVYIVPNQKKSFGRSLSNVKLEEDPTISRLHAVISVEPSEESEESTLYKCVISDLSKYGTFVIRDERKIKLSVEKFVLKAGDTVQFGLKESTFVVSCFSFVTTKSSLDEKDVERLTGMVHLLGGRLCDNWENSCTHLTVPESTLFTTKLACALASAKPIVTIAYWEAVHLAVRESKRLPDIENFLPTVKEEWLKTCSRLLLPNEKRNVLFKGLSFVHFCAKQYFTYLPLIAAAGGKSCVYPTKRPLTPRDLTAKNAVVIQQPVNESSQFTQVIATDYPIIYRKLLAIKRRLISDTEIPLAIFHCSTEMYCNSRFEFAAFLKAKAQTCPTSDVVIIEDTQNTDKIDKRRIKEGIVPETCVSQNNEHTSKDVHSFDESARQRDDVNECDIAQNAKNQRKVRREVIGPETHESQINDDTSRNVRFRNEDGQTDVASKTGIATSDIFCGKIQKQLEIIPESHCSSGEDASVSTLVSDKNDREQARARVVSEISELSEVNVVKDFVARKMRRNAESQRKSSIFTTGKGDDRAVAPVAVHDTQRGDDYLISKKNNAHCTKDSLRLENDDSLNDDKSDHESWQSSTSNFKRPVTLKRPRIVSIEQIDNSGIITIERKRGKASAEGSVKVTKRISNRSEERELDPSRDAGRREKEEKTKKSGIRERREETRKTGANWYERFLNRELTDEILRKDAPCGKKFSKVPVAVPKKILKMDDFILMST